MAERPVWNALRALRNAQRCGFASDRHELPIRPGPRIGAAAGVIADCLVAIVKIR